jgi:hypothetical protein
VDLLDLIEAALADRDLDYETAATTVKVKVDDTGLIAALGAGLAVLSVVGLEVAVYLFAATLLVGILGTFGWMVAGR